MRRRVQLEVMRRLIANTGVLMGGLEEGMRLFHLARDRALGDGLERASAERGTS